MNFFEIIKNSEFKYNEFHLKRYLSLLDKFRKINKDKILEYTERHHILPTSLFPEYKNLNKFKRNLIIVTGRQHFILHWVLAKTFGISQWYSFNMMRRIGNKSILYEYGRKYISEIISSTNTGKTRTEEEKKNASKRFKNTLVVKDKEGNTFRVSLFNEKYLSGEYVSIRIGYKHPKETIDKMIENSGLTGKKAFIGKDKKIVYLKKEEGLKLGLKMGVHESLGISVRENMKNRIWVTEIISKKHKRIYKEQFNDKIYIIGREGYKGWNHINNKNKLN